LESAETERGLVLGGAEGTSAQGKRSGKKGEEEVEGWEVRW